MFDKEKEFNRLIKLGYSATSAIALIENADYCKKREEELKERIEELRQKAIMDEKATYAKGLEKGKLEVAKKMLELKISKETIAKATGLTIQEIENISN